MIRRFSVFFRFDHMENLNFIHTTSTPSKHYQLQFQSRPYPCRVIDIASVHGPPRNETKRNHKRSERCWPLPQVTSLSCIMLLPAMPPLFVSCNATLSPAYGMHTQCGSSNSKYLPAAEAVASAAAALGRSHRTLCSLARRCAIYLSR